MDDNVSKGICVYMCDWVTLLYSRKLTEHCKPAMMEKIKIIQKKEYTYNVVLVSGVQQSESVIHIHISILFQILLPYRLFLLSLVAGSE